MKTIDTKSLLLGVLAVLLVITITSSKSAESNNFDMVAFPNGVGILNKTTNTIYHYKSTISGGIQEKYSATYKLNADGSGLAKTD